MNSIFLQYQLGEIKDATLCRMARQLKFGELLECSSPRCYNYSKEFQSKKVVPGVSCLEMDNTTGQFLLSSADDGSVGLWSLDEKLDATDDELYNKRIQYSARSRNKGDLSSLSSSPTKNRAKTSSPSPRMVHSFETRQNKFRMYRQSSDITNVIDNEETQNSSPNEGHQYGITSLKWYAVDNGMFFTGSNDCFVKLWDTNTFEPVQEIDMGYRINQIDTDSSGSYIVVASEDYYPRLIDLKNVLSSGITHLSHGKMENEILCCKSNPTRSHIVSTGDSEGNVKLWDLRMRNRLYMELTHRQSNRETRAHLKSCNDICWSDNGNQLTTIGTDGKCYIWSPFTGSAPSKQIGPIDLMRNKFRKRTSQRLLCFDSYILCNTDYGEIQIFETESGKLWNKIDHPLPRSEKIGSMFTSFAIQRSLANSRGLRLYLGTSNALIYEYT